MLEHLRVQGAQRIALLLGRERRNAYLETEAVYRGLAQGSGMPCRVAQVDEAEGEEGGYRATLALLEEDPRIDALCVPVDAFAVGAVRALHECGRRVPQDVLVITRYDGVRARTCEPALSAVDLHLEQTAQLAVELLFEQLQGTGTVDVRSGAAPTLVVRASTARVEPHSPRQGADATADAAQHAAARLGKV
jgi:DNA-binding LacI/PurR family transcriptional regulator